MTLWTKLKTFVEQIAGGTPEPQSFREDELHLAAAALLVRATVIDGEVDKRERTTLKALLEERYELSASEATRLISAAEEEEHDAVDLYGFTSVLTRKLDQDGRRKIVEMLWEIVMADGVVHEFEANLVWRVAELLGISSRDRIALRKTVERRQRDSAS